jgi:hypothetical protein
LRASTQPTNRYDNQCVFDVALQTFFLGFIAAFGNEKERGEKALEVCEAAGKKKGGEGGSVWHFPSA